MRAKPSNLRPEYGAWFQDQQIVDAYHHRPPYPGDAIEQLASLADHGPRTVLDLGCGIGDLARRLAPEVARVDAIDASAAMVARGRDLPGGDHPNLHWQHGVAEDAVLHPPYALATAGESLHWMDWDVVLPRLARALSPDGALAIVTREWGGPPALRARIGQLFARYSPVRDFRPYDVVVELESRGLFTRSGERHCGPSSWRPTVEEYIEGRHSQAGGSRTHMGDADAEAFDQDLRSLLHELVRSGEIRMVGDRLDLTVEARLTWGFPRELRHQSTV